MFVQVCFRTILKLLSREDQALLIGWDAFLVLDLGLDIVDSVRGFNLEGDGLAREGLDEAICRKEKNRSLDDFVLFAGSS